MNENNKDEDFVEAEIIEDDEGTYARPVQDDGWRKGDNSVIRKVAERNPLSREDKTEGEEEPGFWETVWIKIKGLF